MSEPFGIVPNSIEPPKVAPSIIASLVKRVYASLLIPNSVTAERKLNAFIIV